MNNERLMIKICTFTCHTHDALSTNALNAKLKRWHGNYQSLKFRRLKNACQLFWTRFQVAVVCSSFSVLCSSSSPVLYTFSLVFLVFSTVFSVNTIQNSSPFMKWELKAMSSSTSQSRIWSVDCAKVMDNARFVSTSRNILTVGLLWRYTRRSRSSAVSRR